MRYDFQLCWCNCWKIGCRMLRKSQYKPSVWFQTFSEISLILGRVSKISKVIRAPTFQCEVCKNIHHFSDNFCPFFPSWILISQNPIWKSKCNYETYKLRNNYLPDKLILSIIGSSMMKKLFYVNIYEAFINLFTDYELFDKEIIWLFVKLLQTWESLK